MDQHRDRDHHRSAADCEAGQVIRRREHLHARECGGQPRGDRGDDSEHENDRRQAPRGDDPRDPDHQQRSDDRNHRADRRRVNHPLIELDVREAECERRNGRATAERDSEQTKRPQASRPRHVAERGGELAQNRPSIFVPHRRRGPRQLPGHPRSHQQERRQNHKRPAKIDTQADQHRRHDHGPDRAQGQPRRALQCGAVRDQPLRYQLPDPDALHGVQQRHRDSETHADPEDHTPRGQPGNKQRSEQYQHDRCADQADQHERLLGEAVGGDRREQAEYNHRRSLRHIEPGDRPRRIQSCGVVQGDGHQHVRQREGQRRDQQHRPEVAEVADRERAEGGLQGAHRWASRRGRRRRRPFGRPSGRPGRPGRRRPGRASAAFARAPAVG